LPSSGINLSAVVRKFEKSWKKVEKTFENILLLKKLAVLLHSLSRKKTRGHEEEIFESIPYP